MRCVFTQLQLSRVCFGLTDRLLTRLLLLHVCYTVCYADGGDASALMAPRQAQETILSDRAASFALFHHPLLSVLLFFLSVPLALYLLLREFDSAPSRKLCESVGREQLET